MYLGGLPNNQQLKNDPFLHWQRRRGKEGLENGYCLGLGCFITLAEGKRIDYLLYIYLVCEKRYLI